jgi:hypothetical protein
VLKKVVQWYGCSKSLPRLVSLAVSGLVSALLRFYQRRLFSRLYDRANIRGKYKKIVRMLVDVRVTSTLIPPSQISSLLCMSISLSLPSSLLLLPLRVA